VATVSQLGLALACRSETVSVFRLGGFKQAATRSLSRTLVLQVLIIYVPFLQSAFGTRALPPVELGICLVLSTVAFWGAELEKLGSRFGRARPS
jgi:Ca2+-transporting ATPase